MRRSMYRRQRWKADPREIGSVQSGRIAPTFFFRCLGLQRFSFSGAHAWANGPRGPIGAVERLGILQKTQARWHAWREERAQRRMRRRVEETRISGRKPVS